MKTVSKGVLKARLLEIFRELESCGGELIVTDFNRPVLRVAPYRPQITVEEAFGALRTRCQIPEVVSSTTWNDWPS
jgi:antitoxin (DNA-binding transcriptional repressor) of toxin-antitoxin stability system